MKNKILIIAALALAINAWAQTSQTTFSDDKSSSMYRNVDGSHFSAIKPEWEKGRKEKPKEHTVVAATASDYFCMEHNKMYAVASGTSTCINTYIRLQDGSIVMPSGAVISSTGKVVHLKNGERVDIKGTLTCSEKGNNPKEEAAGPEN